MLRFAAAFAILSLPAALAAQEQSELPKELAAPQEIGLPQWLTGTWAQSDGERRAVETWSVGEVRLMGDSRQWRGDTLELQERLVIERTGGGGDLVLIAQPGNATPVVFPMVRQDASSIEFANPQHDYPQRIRYWREGEGLNAEISMIDGTRAVRWSYLPAD